MANSDVRAAMGTLDTAIQALDTSALAAATFNADLAQQTSYTLGLKDHLQREVACLQLLSAEAVQQFDNLIGLER